MAGGLLLLAGLMMFSTGLIGEMMMRQFYFESQDRRIYAVREILTRKQRGGRRRFALTTNAAVDAGDAEALRKTREQRPCLLLRFLSVCAPPRRMSFLRTLFPHPGCTRTLYSDIKSATFLNLWRTYV